VTCQHALELMGDLVDDDLDRRRRLRLRLHLLLCRHCRRYLSSYRATVRAAKGAYRSIEAPGANEEIPDQQVAAILKELRRS
jgi:anti-sigma factor RsiW